MNTADDRLVGCHTSYSTASKHFLTGGGAGDRMTGAWEIWCGSLIVLCEATATDRLPFAYVPSASHRHCFSGAWRESVLRVNCAGAKETMLMLCLTPMLCWTPTQICSAVSDASTAAALSTVTTAHDAVAYADCRTAVTAAAAEQVVNDARRASKAMASVSAAATAVTASAYGESLQAVAMLIVGCRPCAVAAAAPERMALRHWPLHALYGSRALPLQHVTSGA